MLARLVTHSHTSNDPGVVMAALNQFWLGLLEKISKFVARNVYTFNRIEK